MATMTALAAYGQYGWEDGTKLHFASKPGVAMALWWQDSSAKKTHNVQLHSREGKSNSYISLIAFLPI